MTPLLSPVFNMRRNRQRRRKALPVTAERPRPFGFSRSMALAEAQSPPPEFPPSVTIPHTDDAIEWSFEGDSLIVDFSRLQGIDGTPQVNGWITLEKHPDLQPFRARGIGSDPGIFYRLSTDCPQVTAALDGPTNAVVSAPYRVEAPELPPWADDEDLAASARQLEYCQRVFWRWGRNNFRRYLREVFRTAPISGFYVGEIVADLVDIDGTEFLMPHLPAYRAPWTVRKWINQGETLRGIQFNFTGTDSFGGFGADGQSRVVIPIEKLMHIASGQVGANWEGVSWLRPVWQHIKMLQSLLQTWALSTEINGVGTMIVTTSESAPIAVDASDLIEEHLGNYAAEDVPTINLPPGMDIKHISPQQQIPDMTAHVIVLERMISMALKNSHSLIALQKTGSFAARADASSEARDGWKFIADEFISNPIETQIFERFIRINFPEDVAAGRIFVPQLNVAEVAARDPKEAIDTIAAAAAAGLLDHPEFGDVIRGIVGLPAKTLPVTAEPETSSPVTEELELPDA